MKTDWDKRLLELGSFIAGWSKDRSTKVGAIITNDENRVVSIGYNGFPAGCNDDVDERHERPAKYLWTEHAERNAIYNAALIGCSTKGCTMHLMWFPCADCARGIIQSGIKKVVCHPPDLDNPKWGEHFEVALQMFKEANIKIEYS